MNLIGNPDQNPNVETPQLDTSREAIKSDCCHQRDALSCEICGLNRDAEALQKRMAELQIFLSDQQSSLPKLSAATLLKYESTKRKDDPEFDVTSLSSQRLVRIIKRERASSEALEENRIKNARADKTEKSEADYESRISTLKAEGLSNVEIIKTLVKDPATPESERSKLVSFAKLIDIAETPEDQTLVTKKINVLNLAALPEPQAFITMQVIDGPTHKTGFSEAFQEKVANAYRIVRPPKVIAHSDVRKLAQHKETFTNPETGEVTERYIYDSPDNMAEVRPGVGTYMGGERMMLKSIAGNVTKDVTGWSDTAIGLTAELMGFHAVTEYFGVTGFVETLGNLSFSGLGSDAFRPDKVRQMRPVISALVGGFTGYEGEVFDAREKMGLIRTQMEMLAPQGDTTGWASDSARVQATLEDLGLHRNGVPDLDRIKVFGSLTQSNLLIGSMHYQSLKAKLDGFS